MPSQDQKHNLRFTERKMTIFIPKSFENFSFMKEIKVKTFQTYFVFSEAQIVWS